MNKRIDSNKRTSRADTNCRGRRAAFRSWVLLSRSNRALASEDSNSEGLCLEGELAAILLTAAMIVSVCRKQGDGENPVGDCCWLVGWSWGGESRKKRSYRGTTVQTHTHSELQCASIWTNRFVGLSLRRITMLFRD